MPGCDLTSMPGMANQLGRDTDTCRHAMTHIATQVTQVAHITLIVVLNISKYNSNPCKGGPCVFPDTNARSTRRAHELMLASASTRVLSTSGPQRFGSIISRRTGVMVCVAAQPSAPEALEESPFPRLGRNAALYKEVGGGKKFRQHVNPLKKELATPPPPPDWAAVYADPGLPLIVDVGAGYGRFLLGLAQTGAAGGLHNHLGFEIRGSVVDRAQDWAAALGVARSVHFVLANATLSLGPVLRSYPGRLDLVTIQFPDPQFKRRHRKRRIVQRGLVDSVAELMPRGGRVFLQSDVLEVRGGGLKGGEHLHGLQWTVPEPLSGSRTVWGRRPCAPADIPLGWRQTMHRDNTLNEQGDSWP